LIRIHLLGNLKISHRDIPVNLVTGGKILSLLAFLLINRESPQSRKYISFLFWPDSSEQQALTNLRKLFHQLRQFIPDADRYFVADSFSIKWNHEAPYTLDIEEFELSAKGTAIHDLKRAVDIYTGLLLPGCYEGWIESERERLSRLYQSVLEQLVAKLETRRLYSEAIQYAARLVGLDNLKEEYYQILMRLHGLNGDLTGITKIFQECERTLRDELGVQPSDITKNVYRSMLQAGVNHVMHPVHAETPFIGRNGEWEKLTSL
jgi:DNA-binding SARP family transcriptional activator